MEEGKKLKQIVISFLCVITILLTLVYVAYIVSHKDKTRDNNVYNDNNNITLIEKNIVDACKDLETTGKISFSLPKEDINQMLHNASSNIFSDGSTNMYYDINGDHHYFCFDLKPRLFVETRVVVDTVIEGFNQDFDMILGISSLI